MKTALVAAALGLAACTSVETAVVSPNEVAANGETVAVVQATAIGITALFNAVDVVKADLDTVVNRLLVAEAKAMGANKVDVKTAETMPRHGVFAVFGPPLTSPGVVFPTTGVVGFNLIGFPVAKATGVAVK